MLRYILFAIFFLGTFRHGYSTHIVGGEMNYRLLQNGAYEISLKVYRDCYLGIPDFDAPGIISIFDGNNNFLRRVNIIRPPKEQLPVDINDDCWVVPPSVCVERIEYLDTLELAPNESGYILSYQRCCRNASIVNIYDDLNDNVSSSGANFWAFIPPQQPNSNPVFKEFPPVAICANKPLIFDHSAIDYEGDSLVYRLCTPYDALSEAAPIVTATVRDNPPFRNVRWKAPYSPENVLGGPEVLSIDSKTGLLTALTNTVGQFVVGVCVEEYRNGVLLSETKRDFQFNVADCRRLITASYFSADTTCNSLVVRFRNQSVDAIRYSWDFGDGTTSDLRDPVHTFPDYGRYSVRLVAHSSYGCTDTLTKWIHLVEDHLQLNPEAVIACQGETIEIDLHPGGEVVSRVTWYTDPVSVTQEAVLPMVVQRSGALHFEVQTQKGCKYNGMVNITAIASPQISAHAEPDTIYKGEAVSLSVIPSTGYEYAWSPAQLVKEPSRSLTSALPSADQTFRVEVKDLATGCKSVDSVQVKVLSCTDTLDLSIVRDVRHYCNKADLLLQASSGHPDVSFIWIWEGEAYDTDSATFHIGDFDEHPYRLIVSHTGGCQDTLSYTFRLNRPDIGYQAGTYRTCSRDSVRIDLDIESILSYRVYWQHLPGEIFTTDTLMYRVDSVSGYLLFQVDFDELCILTDSVAVIPSVINVQAVADENVIARGATVHFSTIPDNFYRYQWEPEAMMSDASVTRPSASPEVTTLFTVRVEDELGCAATDTVWVRVIEQVWCSDADIYVPNAFSPNGDGKNDTWKIRSNVVQEIYIAVYNRWGERVFETYDPEQGWDGTFRDKPANPDSYSYYIKAQCEGGQSYYKKGNLTLIR